MNLEYAVLGVGLALVVFTGSQVLIAAVWATYDHVSDRLRVARRRRQEREWVEEAQRRSHLEMLKRQRHNELTGRVRKPLLPISKVDQ